MQIRAPAVAPRFLASRRAAARPRVAERSWREDSLAPGPIVCLRLTGQLCDGTAGALAAAVGDRVRAVMPPACAVVLDVSATPDVDDAARAALLSLCDILSESRTRLWLVVPGAEARALLCCGGTASAIGLDALHTSVRAAILAAHAALPGPALVTPAMRALLTQPPEPLTLLSDPG